jgi:mRNA interferase MazF
VDHVKRGEIWWTDFGPPRDSEPGFRRPVVIVQADAFNRSTLRTVIVANITSNVRLARAPGNVLLRKGTTPLDVDSVINVSQISTVNKSDLDEPCGQIDDEQLKAVDDGLRNVFCLSNRR